MGTAWGRAKRALGLNLCVHVPSTLDDAGERSTDGRPSVGSDSDLGYPAGIPTTPTPTSSGLRLSKSGGRSSKRTCTICLGTMELGYGDALFTAECLHTFHFHCISSNIKHGNYVCPVCRAKWKEMPFCAPPSSECNLGRSSANNINSTNWQRGGLPLLNASDPGVFNDDEPLQQPETPKESPRGSVTEVEIKTYPESPAVPQSSSREDFGILIHLKAPRASVNPISGSTGPDPARAPVDLVMVLDISGSMAGTKLALLKRSMGFVIQNLGPFDRLSVIAFSSSARRLFHLRRMSDAGRQQALQAVNSLVAGGGTNIAEALRKAAKVIEERSQKHPVSSIVLLSDGQDTYTLSSNGSAAPDHKLLVPSSILGAGHQVPVHTFGFGTDHDSATMHSIADGSSGTFSFIEDEGAIQDAFALCIGGLLSVVAQEMRVSMECVHPAVQLLSIRSGSYASRMSGDGRTGLIEVGNLYADEERDFLISVNVPQAYEHIVLLQVCCRYRDSVSNETIKLKRQEVSIQRPLFVVDEVISIEVGRERNRLEAADAMAAARAAAERGALSEAVSILEDRQRILSESIAGRSGDRMCAALVAELREMQERMANRQRYEASGRAYVLSGLSSHSWQRATARGDSTDSASLVYSYQTPLMTDMLQRSQTLCPSPRGDPRPQIRSVKSFPSKPQPR